MVGHSRKRATAGSVGTPAAADMPYMAGEDPGRPREASGNGTADAAAHSLAAAADPETAARQICLQLLTVEPRTRAQLADALRRRGVPEQAAEAVLERFTEAGLIDDPVFARAWVESRHHSRGLSRRMLAAELQRRGVDDDDVRDAIDTLDPEQEAATARRLVETKIGATRGQPPPARIRRLMGMLARKGYSAGLAYRVVREALEQEGAGLAGAVPEPDPDFGLDDPAW